MPITKRTWCSSKMSSVKGAWGISWRWTILIATTSVNYCYLTYGCKIHLKCGLWGFTWWKVEGVLYHCSWWWCTWDVFGSTVFVMPEVQCRIVIVSVLKTMIITTTLCSNIQTDFVLQIHEKLRQYERQSPIPVLHSACSLAEDVSLSHLHPCLSGRSHQSQWVSSSWEAKVNFNVLKVLNHADVHLMKLHITLLSRSHRLSVRETADLSCLLLICPCVDVRVSVCNLLSSKLRCALPAAYRQDCTRSGAVVNVVFCVW